MSNRPKICIVCLKTCHDPRMTTDWDGMLIVRHDGVCEAVLALDGEAVLDRFGDRKDRTVRVRDIHAGKRWC